MIHVNNTAILENHTIFQHRSAIAPRQPLLRCPNKLHPCNDALPTTAHPWTYALPCYPPSMAVYAEFWKALVSIFSLSTIRHIT